MSCCASRSGRPRRSTAITTRCKTCDSSRTPRGRGGGASRSTSRPCSAAPAAWPSERSTLMPERTLEDLIRTSSTGKPYGVADQGFLPKPVGRLLDEKLAAAQVLFGEDIDLTSGSALRKIL